MWCYPTTRSLRPDKTEYERKQENPKLQRVPDDVSQSGLLCIQAQEKCSAGAGREITKKDACTLESHRVCSLVEEVTK